MSLSELRILITGGGRGIGRAIAQICQEEGAKVAICSRTKSELEETASSFDSVVAPNTNTNHNDENDDNNDNNNKRIKMYHHPMEIFVADILKQNQVENMVTSLVEKWGDIDILINNAGKGQRCKGQVYTLDTDDLVDIFKVNVVGVHIVTSTVLKKCMLKSPQSSDGIDKKSSHSIRRIINISSGAAKRGLPNIGFYVTSKFALEGYSATLAEELKDENIIVNTISPGKVNTKNFPKEADTVGLRSAESIKDGLLLLLKTDKTGHYLHVDELDLVRLKGLDDSLALKPMNEPKFRL